MRQINTRLKGEVSFRFLGKTTVTYHNPDRTDTYGSGGARPVKYELASGDGGTVEINGPAIRSPYAEKIRNGEILQIDVFLKS